MSIDYYTRLERGNLSGVSDSVLDALARALQLDEAERTHLFDLARTANTSAAAVSNTGANTARFIFLDPAAQTFYLEWERLAADTVAMLRAEAGRDPHDRALTDLVGELSTRSEPFRTWWAAHNVRLHRTGVKRFHHPAVGDLVLAYESMDLTADQGLRLNAYTAEPGSASQQALHLLASWTAAPHVS